MRTNQKSTLVANQHAQPSLSSEKIIGFSFDSKTNKMIRDFAHLLKNAYITRGHNSVLFESWSRDKQ